MPLSVGRSTNSPPELPGGRLSAQECAQYSVPPGAVWGCAVATDGLTTQRSVVLPAESGIAAAFSFSEEEDAEQSEDEQSEDADVLSAFAIEEIYFDWPAFENNDMGYVLQV